MKNSLEKCGCRVVTVATGDELVRRAVSDVKFDIIFSTFFSSNLNCIDIFKLIRNTNGANCSTPFIVLTAYYEEAFKINVFDGVVEKPITESQLRSILSKYALRKAQEREDTLLSDVDSDILLDF
jgi:serine/threonine-protein kinase RIM15